MWTIQRNSRKQHTVTQGSLMEQLISEPPQSNSVDSLSVFIATATLFKFHQIERTKMSSELTLMKHLQAVVPLSLSKLPNVSAGWQERWRWFQGGFERSILQHVMRVHEMRWRLSIVLQDVSRDEWFHFCHQYCLWHFSLKWYVPKTGVESNVIHHHKSIYFTHSPPCCATIGFRLSSHQPNTYYMLCTTPFLIPTTGCSEAWNASQGGSKSHSKTVWSPSRPVPLEPWGCHWCTGCSWFNRRLGGPRCYCIGKVDPTYCWWLVHSCQAPGPLAGCAPMWGSLAWDHLSENLFWAARVNAQQ